MAEGSPSPPLFTERCDEDIDLLTEMLSKHSDASTDEHDVLNVSGKLLDENVDELSNYLCGNSNSIGAELSHCRGEHDPFMSPTASAREAKSEPSLSTSRSSTTGLTSLITRGGAFSKVKSEDSDIMQQTSVVLVVPRKETHANVNKSALAARENRKRKKQYVQQLEVKVDMLETEKSKLSAKLSSQEETIEYLKEQVKYLQSVIENQTTLSALLKNIENTSGVQIKSSWSTRRKLTEVGPANSAEMTTESEEPDEDQENKASIFHNKRKCEFESENTESNKRVNIEKSSQHLLSEDSCSERREVEDSSAGGVCLHVSGSEVSLEFCVMCSKMASTGRVLNDHSYVRSIVD